MSDNEFAFGIIVVAAISIVLIFASGVGMYRADALKECYKAAQVNHNIKCEVSHDH